MYVRFFKNQIIVIKIRLVRQNEIYQNLYLKDDAFKAVCLKD